MEGTETTKTQEPEGKTTEQTQTQSQTVDVERVKSEATADYLKSLGVESDEALKEILKKHRETEDANKTDLQKATDTLTATTKELAEEREARIMAEAKVSALKLGAKLEVVDDLVVIAKSKVTKEKDIDTVMAEIKAGATGSVYFASEEEQKEQTKPIVTRKPVSKKDEKAKDSKEGTKGAGTIAQRLLANRKPVKSSYYKN